MTPCEVQGHRFLTGGRGCHTDVALEPWCSVPGPGVSLSQGMAPLHVLALAFPLCVAFVNTFLIHMCFILQEEAIE